MFSQSQLTDRFTGAVWLDSDRNITDHHRQPYDGEDRLPPTASSLGPIGPPSKIPKPPIVGGPPKSVSTSSVGGRGEIGPPGRGSDAGGRFSPIGWNQNQPQWRGCGQCVTTATEFGPFACGQESSARPGPSGGASPHSREM